MMDSFRAGMLNWGGERPILPNQLTRTFKTLGRLIVQGLDLQASACHANYHAFYINNFNDPMAAEAGFHGFEVSVDDSDDHNIEHDNLISYGFKRVRVLRAMVRLRVDIQSASSEDWVCAWRFHPGAISVSNVPKDPPADDEYDLAPDVILLWRQIRNNPGWQYVILSGTQAGGSPYPTATTIEIPIPNVKRLGDKLNRGYVTSADPSARSITLNQDYEHELVDASHLTDFPLASVHLGFYMFKVRGGLLVDGDATVECEILQKIRSFRDTERLLDDNPDEHA